MASYFNHFGFVAAFTAVVIGGLAWLIGRAKPMAQSLEGGTIAPEKWSAIFTVAGGLLFLALGVATIIAGGLPVGLAAVAMGAAIAGFMAPSLTNAHVVHWTRDYVEGPARMFGPTLGAARTRINWDDIVRTGKTITGYWFIETADRRRIYWSYLYKGYGAFVRRLHARCPALVLPGDLDSRS
ncbi:MAG TPA: hypothetical protein VG501_12330 [Rhizomicrobium sp.]|nr:hypothetical protein [Rhizomicrobium sp.]